MITLQNQNPANIILNVSIQGLIFCGWYWKQLIVYAVSFTITTVLAPLEDLNRDGEGIYFIHTIVDTGIICLFI